MPQISENSNEGISNSGTLPTYYLITYIEIKYNIIYTKKNLQ
jgi:hypothetical protein